AAIEQEMPMTAASIFWHETLYDCNLDQSLQLPFDRYRLADEHRTGRGISVSFNFGEDLSRAFLTYSSSNGITPEQLLLASYFAFLFKLTNGESDLCIGMNTDGRYKEELMLVIGMMAIEMIGAVYCPLSPRDPEHRLYMLVEQTQSRLVLTHHLTNNKFTDNIFSIDIDAVLTDNPVESDVDFYRTSNIVITSDNIAYIIFTSGSTGMPKAVGRKLGY
ncbi:unnamed protein product, partial [Rotaria sordida]